MSGQPPHSQQAPEEVDIELGLAAEEAVRLQKRQAELEQRKQQLQIFSNRKLEFVEQKSLLESHIGKAIDAVTRDIPQLEAELTKLKEVVLHLEKYESSLKHIDHQAWTADHQAQLTLAEDSIDQISQNYDQITEYFANSRSAHLFQAKKKNHSLVTNYIDQFKNGLAFNIPIVLLGIVLILLFIFKR